MQNLKILVIGYGSIGKRHVSNLLKISNNQISICTRNKDIEKIKKKNVKVFETINDALKEEFDVVIICNETSLHVKTALKFAEKGCHIFFEKPISDSLEGISKLRKIIKQKKMIKI